MLAASTGTPADGTSQGPVSMNPDHAGEISEQQDTGLLRSSAIVGAMTMLSRVLGLVRDIVIAGFVGATANADAFFVAFKVPQFLRRLFAEGAFSQAFVPVLAEYREQGSQAAVKDLLNRVAGVLGGSLILVTGFMVLAAPLITALFAPGFIGQPEKYALTADMIRITFPYLFLISMTGFCGAVLNSYGRFAIPAFTPVWLNISLITAASLATPLFEEPVFALAWGVFLAGVVQLLFQLPFLYQLKMVPRPIWDTGDPGVRQIMTLMIPALFGVSVSQINLLLDTVLASFLPTGSVSWLYYSDRLTELPLGVFGIAIATVILPSLSRQQASESGDAFSKTLDWALRSVLLIGLPASLALLVLAQPILISLFQYGALQPHDVHMASLSLQAYCVGLLPFMLIKILAPGYYARKDMKTPVKIGIIAMVANMVLNLVLVIPLHSYWQVGHVGLALATSLAAFINAGLLFRGLRAAGVYHFQPGWSALLLRLLVSSSLMLAVLYWLVPPAAQWLEWSWYVRAQQMAMLVASGLGTYLIAQVVLGTRISDFYAPKQR
jgi:putative peptidoglycan lipid II flippase